MKNVTVTDNQFREEVAMVEEMFGLGDAPVFTGELLAVNPSAEEFATYDENFKGYVRKNPEHKVIEGVVYFDKGANRAFILDADQVEITEVN